LEISAGREITNLFEVYHKLSTKNSINSNLKYIGELKTTGKLNLSCILIHDNRTSSLQKFGLLFRIERKN
jgi:hypothetical protein